VVRHALIALATVALLLTGASTALGHAYLTASSPEPDTKLEASPPLVTLTFNEPVQLLRSGDATVFDEEGNEVNSAPADNGQDSRTIQIPLRPGLPDGTYTVRYQIIGADSHIIPGAYVFGVGPGELGEPYFGGGGGGPSETGPWGTSSRFLEIIGLGGLIGLLGFRWLVWAPAVGRMRGVRPAEQEAVLNWGRDTFWVGFGVFAIGAMLAEGYLLVVQSATALGTGVWSALRDTNGISQVLSDTRFGSLVQLRGALLFALFAIGAILFIREYGSSGAPKPATVTGSKTAGAVMAVLLIVVLGGIASQGHASVTEMSNLQVAAQAVHIVAVSVWIVGLAMVAITMVRLPKVAANAGPGLAARVLSRFSGVALVAVGVAILTGVLRSVGELSDPAELWGTDYGRSILYKVALLVPIGVIALYNRRIVAALQGVQRPNGPTLRLVRRTAGTELALSLVIVLIASVLAAQVPGGA
jgi:copper transport protein